MEILNNREQNIRSPRRKKKLIDEQVIIRLIEEVIKNGITVDGGDI